MVEGELASYTVSVDKAAATDLKVDVVTGHITTSNGDLVPVTTTVTILAGTSSANFTVTTLDDAYADSGETFTASITGSTGGGFEKLVLGTSSITTTINEPPTVKVTDTDGGVSALDNSVLEASSGVINGDVSFSASLGIKSVTIGGQDVTNATTTPVTITTTEGTLTVNGYNAATGKITYSYQEDGKSETHNAANDNVKDSFTVTVTDNLGNTATDSLDIQILDSTVTAIADSRTVTEDQVGITGNVVTGVNANADTLGVDTPIAVTGVQAGTVATEITTGLGGPGVAGTYGTFTLAANGAYTYVTNATAQTLNAGDNKADVFSYTIKDADGDFSTTTVTFTVQGTNDAPTISAAQSGTVSEEGLANAIQDTTGNPTDVTNATTFTGQFTVSDVDNVETVTLGIPGISLKSGGSDIVWSLSNANHTLTGTAAGQTVMTVVIDDTGSYTTTLLKPIDHPSANGENLQSIPITVTVSDGTATASSTISINVEDDAPVASNVVASVTLPNVNTNIELILDVSGSMGTADAGGGKTRMALLIEAINGIPGTPGLLDSYDNLGDVRVRIVTFATTAAQQGTTWLTIAQAKTYVAALVPTSATNYEAAITLAQSVFDSAGKIPNAQNVWLC